MKTSKYWTTKTDMPEHIKSEIITLLNNADKITIPIKGSLKNILLIDGDIFKKIFSINRKYLYKGNFTADPNSNDYSSSRNYVTENGLSGFSITEDGWLVSMFSNHTNKGFMNNISDFLKNNVKKLECITTDNEPFLIKMYVSYLGFNIVARTLDDTEDMYKEYSKEFVDLFLTCYGHPYHVFMIKKNIPVPGIKTIEGYINACRYVNELSGSLNPSN